MQERVNPRAKRNVTLAIDAVAVDAATAKGMDLASILEEALQSRLRQAASSGLSDDDRAAIEFHNRFEAKHGKWSDGLEKL